MAIDIEKRIIHITDADGNKKFAEVREYQQYQSLRAVLPVTFEELTFSFVELNESNQEVWSTDIDGVTFTGTFNAVVDVTNTGKFDDVVSKPKTNRLDTF